MGKSPAKRQKPAETNRQFCRSFYPQLSEGPPSDFTLNKRATLTTSESAVHNQNRQMVTPPKGWGLAPFHTGV